jgi:hypothetical protein
MEQLIIAATNHVIMAVNAVYTVLAIGIGAWLLGAVTNRVEELVAVWAFGGRLYKATTTFSLVVYAAGFVLLMLSIT